MVSVILRQSTEPTTRTIGSSRLRRFIYNKSDNSSTGETVRDGEVQEDFQGTRVKAGERKQSRLSMAGGAGEHCRAGGQSRQKRIKAGIQIYKDQKGFSELISCYVTTKEQQTCSVWKE